MIKSILVILLLSANAKADDYLSGFQSLLAEKLKEAKPVAMINLKAQSGGAAFLPIYTLHSIYGKDANGKEVIDIMKDYFELGLGYKGQEGQKPGGFLAMDFNIIGISRKLLSGQWMESHVKKSLFPPIFIGPTMQLPLDMHRINIWTFGDNFGAMASVRF